MTYPSLGLGRPWTMEAGLLRSLSVVLGVMALLAVAETYLPFREGNGRRWQRLAPNLGLTAVTLALNLLCSLGGTVVIEWSSTRRTVGLSDAVLPAHIVVLAGLVLLDGTTYVLHRLMHRIPILWHVHRVHHDDDFVDVTTTFRQHPLETFLRIAVLIVATVILGLPSYALAVYRTISALNAQLEHANVALWRPFDEIVSLAIVTPNMHKVHHARRPPETDSNYGNIFSIFDRTFRTFLPGERAASIEYGLEDVVQ
jgi:sterol desaturase/sphingolipid hydroxylase (fatty acid hydroxylase superfamily)